MGIEKRAFIETFDNVTGKEIPEPDDLAVEAVVNAFDQARADEVLRAFHAHNAYDEQLQSGIQRVYTIMPQARRAGLELDFYVYIVREDTPDRTSAAFYLTKDPEDRFFLVDTERLQQEQEAGRQSLHHYEISTLLGEDYDIDEFIEDYAELCVIGLSYAIQSS